jgi:prolipoprotein diacylglyceryltransferase
MRQVLFHLPIYIFNDQGIPIFGYGTMLFLAFVACTFLATWLARREGIAKEYLQDLAIWSFVCGILGARITFMIQYQIPVEDFYKIWDGGLVFYGSAVGGLVGYLLAYLLILRKHKISTWKVADIAAPCVAVGLCLGRLGCYLNGCCYGNVACPHCPAVHFPITSPAIDALVQRGLQTKAGFTVKDTDRVAEVDKVEPDSPADRAGLKPGDEIVAVNGQEITGYYDPDNPRSEHTLWGYLLYNWPRGETEVALKVKRPAEGSEAKDSKEKDTRLVLKLEPFEPETLGLHPTQLYESISMALALLLLLAYYPFKRHDGAVMVLFMFCYAVHRFLNEILRKDTDPVAYVGEYGLTLSQVGSVLVFVAAVGLAVWLWRKPVQYPAGTAGAA